MNGMSRYEMNVDDERRREVEALLRCPIPDEHWGALKKADSGGTPFRAQEYADLYRVWAEWGLLVPPVGPKPPASWVKRSEHALRRFEPLQRAALAQLRRTTPIPLEELEAALLEEAESAPDDGPTLRLEYPLPDETNFRVIWIHGGTPDEQTWNEFVNDLRSPPSAVDVGERRFRKIPPLARIVHMAQLIAGTLGCHVWQAVGFLLSDVAFTLPWAEAWVDMGTEEFLGASRLWVGPEAAPFAADVIRGSLEYQPRFTVSVGGPDVPMPVVAEAYRMAREQWARGGVKRHELSSEERDRELRKFVSAAGEATWEQRRQAWNAQPWLAPANRFPTSDAMRVAYKRATDDSEQSVRARGRV